jgi:rubrerythrin
MAAQLSLRDVLDKAIQKEIEAQRLYTDLSQKVKDNSARTVFQDLARQELLEKLAAQELEHKQRIESLYTEVAFPQTDGG